MATMGIFSTITAFFIVCLISLECGHLLIASAADFYTTIVPTGDANYDTKRLLNLWHSACVSQGEAKLKIPVGTVFKLYPIDLVGPCRANHVHFQISGRIEAAGMSAWSINSKNHWIKIKNVNGLIIDGLGTIDGHGYNWWSSNALAPTALTILRCNNVILRDVKFINGPSVHIGVLGSTDVHISHITVSAPERSPNTDGVHISRSQHVQVFNSNIRTGDDCISIGTDTSDVNISSITCGPGHGISVGSLGQNGEMAAVDQIHVSDCTFYRTMTAARIKTWQGGHGYARNIIFERLTLNKVKRGIVIDQYYCNGRHGCPNKTEAVTVNNVKFIAIQGSATHKVPINLACSETVACTGIVLNNVQIKPTGPVRKITSYCLNVKGNVVEPVVPRVPCLG